MTFVLPSEVHWGALRQWFDVDISRLQTAVGKHGVFTDQVQSLWEGKLSAGMEYWEPVALVGEHMPDASVGTNIVETFHSRLRAEPTLSGRKGYNTCLLALDMAIKKWNYGILNAKYISGVPDTNPTAPNIRAQWRKRITPGDAAVQLTLDGLQALLRAPLEESVREFVDLFWNLRAYKCPQVSVLPIELAET